MALSPKNLSIAIKALAKLLNNENVKIRLKAAKSLGELGSEKAIPYIKKALEKETDFDVISCLIDAIITINNLPHNQTMSETPKYNFPNAQNIQIVEHTDGGDVIADPSPPSTTVMHFHDKVDGVAGNVEGNLQVNPNSAKTEIDETSNS